MRDKCMLLGDRMEKAMVRIVQMFVEQCQNGAQSKELADAKLCACGQFLGERTKTQRGVHGTAAAIRVLSSDSEKPETRLIQNLVAYVEKRCDVEPDTELLREKLEQDESNVIKQSELLLALNKLPPRVEKQKLAQKLAEKLRAGMNDDSAWSYFLENKGDCEVLPTAYATAALRQYGFTIETRKSVEWLLGQLKDTYVAQKTDLRQRSLADRTIDVFSLYVLTFKVHDTSHEDTLRTVFQKMWKNLRPYVETGSEQNIEYWFEQRTPCYVRVPWDLYVIALTSHYDRRNAFCSAILQRRITTILDQVLNGGFHYSHSGKLVSSRTNAILFEVLARVKEEIRGKKLRTGPKELVRACSSSWYIRAILLVLAIVSIVLIVIGWVRKGDSSPAEIAPNLIGPLICGALGWSLRKPV